MTPSDRRWVTEDVHRGVRVITLDAPAKRNALSGDLLQQLCEALTGRDGGGRRPVVITGRNMVFSAGADLDELAASPSDRHLDDALGEALSVLAALDVPSAVAVEGPCMGAAVDIALACDLVVAAEDAFFDVPALRHGLIYRPTSVARWRGRLPRGTLTRLLLLGERIAGVAARDAGIADVVVPSGEAIAEAVERMCMYRDGPEARNTVAMLRAIDRGTFDAAEWIEMQHAALASSGNEERRGSRPG